MNFNDWFDKLKDNPLWWMRISEMYGKKNLTQVATEVHLYLIGKNELEPVTDEKFTGWRTLFQAFCRKAPDVTGIQLQQVEVEKKVEQAPPLTGEARAKRIQELLDVVQSTPIIQRIRPVTHKEMQENSGWRPKPEDIREPSELEKAAALNAHIEKINTARRKLFLDAYPEAEEDEILAYIKSFEKI